VLKQCVEELRTQGDRLDAVQTDLDCLRDAYAQVYSVVQDMSSESDMDAAVQVCLLRRLEEAIGERRTRLLYEKPGGQKLYSLRYREMKEEIEALTASLHKANSQAEEFERMWYLRGDDLERCAAQRDAANARLREVAVACAQAEAERDAARQELEAARKQLPIAYLWTDPSTRQYVVDRCEHPLEELKPVYEGPVPQKAS
jgi:DNA repair exonuclease SbcCD ATPase subunit